MHYTSDFLFSEWEFGQKKREQGSELAKLGCLLLVPLLVSYTYFSASFIGLDCCYAVCFLLLF